MVLDRPGLEQRVRGCYAVIRREFEDSYRTFGPEIRITSWVIQRLTKKDRA